MIRPLFICECDLCHRAPPVQPQPDQVMALVAAQSVGWLIDEHEVWCVACQENS